jgi:hypothetical protein
MTQEKILQLITQQPCIAWKKTTPQEIIWDTPLNNCSLLYKNNKLIAQEGIYAPASHTWVRMKKTPLADNIDVTFTDITDTGITCITKKNNCSLEHYIALESR